jgi:hypothetical protein
MKIQFQQSGGVAGISRPAVTVDTTSLPPDEAKQWHDLVAAADFFSLPSVTPPGPHRDAFSYRITVEDGGQQHSVQTTSGMAASSLNPLIERLRHGGKAG